MGGAAGAGYKQGVEGATIGFLVGGPIGAVIGGAGGAYQGYSSAKTEKAGRESAAGGSSDVIPPPPPPPPPASTAATLAQAAQATKAKASVGGPGKARASGTIGDLGPEGLQAPPQTANVTLLGGTK